VFKIPETDALQRLSAHGVSVWLDDLSRDLLSGPLDELIEHYSVVGVTTNPTIFASAMARGDRYNEQLRRLALDDVPVDNAVFRITTDDVRSACDRLRAVYDATDRVDGRVCIEVDPGLVHDTEGTISQARRLWEIVGRDNLLVKVPATREGLPAIERLTAEGISVNATLIFSLSRYRQVIDAYLAGLRGAAEQHVNLAGITSVASFFVSRVDAAVERRLGDDVSRPASALRGQVAIANARCAYRIFEAALRDPDWRELHEQGAHAQRPLWASTGVKDPALRQGRYAEELIAPHTVSTMPLGTLCAMANHGRIATDTITDNYSDAERTLEAAEEYGIDMEQVAAELESDGVRTFQASWAQLRNTVAKGMARLDDRVGGT